MILLSKVEGLKSIFGIRDATTHHPILTRKRENTKEFIPVTKFRVLRVLRVKLRGGGNRFPIPVKGFRPLTFENNSELLNYYAITLHDQFHHLLSVLVASFYLSF